eukprot:Nitzschia sp. Nitz4//scaffold145_size56662//34513//36498//NITZ4_006561-RA/size56662-processed-gene-0.17-mRNA-1//1//CDS//3329536589//7621//frame0
MASMATGEATGTEGTSKEVRFLPDSPTGVDEAFEETFANAYNPFSGVATTPAPASPQATTATAPAPSEETEDKGETSLEISQDVSDTADDPPPEPESESEELPQETSEDSDAAGLCKSLFANDTSEEEDRDASRAFSVGFLEDLSERDPVAESSIEVVLQLDSSNPEAATVNTESSSLPSFPISDRFEPILAPKPNQILFGDTITPKLRLYIDDYDSPFFAQLMERLSGQARIVKLDMYRSLEDRKRTPAELAVFFQMAASLPNLTTLHLTHWDAAEGDLQEFALLREHAQLAHVRLDYGWSPSEDQEPGESTVVMDTLLSLPKLTSLTVHVSESCPIQELFQSQTLKRLHVLFQSPSNSDATFEMEDSHVLSFSQSLASHPTLREFHLEPTLSLNVVPLLILALRTNQRLRTLRLSVVSPNPNDPRIDPVMVELAHWMEKNQQLETLQNLNYHALTVTPAHQDRLCQALAKSSLRDFVFVAETPDFTQKKQSILASRQRASPKPRSTPTGSDNKPSCSMNMDAGAMGTCGVWEGLPTAEYTAWTKNIQKQSKQILDRAQTQSKEWTSQMHQLVDRVMPTVTAARGFLKQPSFKFSNQCNPSVSETPTSTTTSNTTTFTLKHKPSKGVDKVESTDNESTGTVKTTNQHSVAGDEYSVDLLA